MALTIVTVFIVQMIRYECGYLRRLYFPTLNNHFLRLLNESLDVPTDFSLLSNFITKSTFLTFLKETILL